MLTFESTHEYYLGPNADIHYCSEHEALIVTRDYEDRVLINGVNKDTMLKFARKLVQKDLDETLAKYEDKDAESKDAVVEDILTAADKAIDDHARNGAFTAD
tara:strand:- start:806 stop:1111 length:306 start_codon:yes stop_codon:yes gene_type:complete